MKRSSYQGVLNIIRFNPHFFVTALFVGIVLISLLLILPSNYSMICCLCLFVLIYSMVVSLAVSHWIYDRSNIYKLPWIKPTSLDQESVWLNINAGFDEITQTLKNSFPDVSLRTMDFYEPLKHTEPSIARARKIYPPTEETEQIAYQSLPVRDASVDRIIAMFSLHEIRDSSERIAMLSEFHRVLAQGGEIYITEHLLDRSNLAAYSLGAFHFHSKKEWLSNIEESNLVVKRKVKTTHFVTTFILTK